MLWISLWTGWREITCVCWFCAVVLCWSSHVMIMSWIAATACSVTMEVTSWRLGVKVAVRTSSCSACPSSFCQRALPCRVSATCRSGSEVLARLNIKLHALPAIPHFSSILRCLYGASACNDVWLHRQEAAPEHQLGGVLLFSDASALLHVLA